MRIGVTLALFIATTSAAFAGGGFEIVIPGRPGVPVIINGVDASYAVVEGDWGLARAPTSSRPSMVAATSIRCRTSAIIIRAPAACPATGGWKSSRRRTADCRSRPRAIINPGRRSRRRCRRNRTCPSIRPPSSTRRRMTGAGRRLFHAKIPANETPTGECNASFD